MAAKGFSMEARKILIVDDDAMNLDILEEYLSEAGYTTVSALDGAGGLRQLEDHPDISLVLLDRMMPSMDGITFMQKFSRNAKFRDIPVIMQTAASSSQEILEGLRAGVFYYLTKPFERDVILNVVRAALENSRLLTETVKEATKEFAPALTLMSSCEFAFRTMEEAEYAASFAAQLFPDPVRATVGLSELAYNAVEHGNLGISYEEKNQLILEGRLKAEIKRRLQMPEHHHKIATLKVSRNTEGTEATITDMGAGFDHASFHHINPLTVTRLNGRGIAIARMMSFDLMTYNQSGNAVICWCENASAQKPNAQNQAQAG